MQPKEFKAGLEAFRIWVEKANVTSYDENTGKGLLRHIYFRKGFATGEIMACAVINGTSIPERELLVSLLREKIQGIKSVVININREKSNVILGKESKTVWGDDYIRDKLLGKTFVISPNSFYQVNHDQCEKLYSKAMEYANLNKNETLLDLYCGVGTIGLTMAGSVKKLIGVEIIGKAIENAKINAKLNNIDNAEFICADAPTAAKKLEKDGIKADVIILDPPRKGCDASLFDTVCQMSPERIVYVSCDSSTLARDLKILDEKGYKTKRVCAVDMFPRTPHVETVCLLSKLNVKHHIEVEITMDELDLTAAESKATYDEIKAYVLEKFGFKVSQLYIAQIKRKCGIIERKNYNQSKKEDAKVPKCPPEKEAAIMDALKHFQMIP